VGLRRGLCAVDEVVEGAICEMMRMLGTRAGLNERSHSAYAIPSPTPVDNEAGHVRPAIKQLLVKKNTRPSEEAIRRLNSTTESTTPTPTPRRLYKNESAICCLDHCTITREPTADLTTSVCARFENMVFH